jgi:hypothetical protein
MKNDPTYRLKYTPRLAAMATEVDFQSLPELIAFARAIVQTGASVESVAVKKFVPLDTDVVWELLAPKEPQR